MGPTACVTRRWYAVCISTVVLLAAPTAAQAVVGTPVHLAEASPQVRITGSGWGHGVGMSQYGAQAQALRGWSASRILRHWYRGVTVGSTARSSDPIVVNLSTTARSPGVTIESGAARWQVCAPRCTWLTRPSGRRLIQRPDSGTWNVTATAGGGLSVRHGETVLWRGTTAVTLRVKLSASRDERIVARVLRTRYRWGELELGAHNTATCRAPSLCVNVRVPSVERYLYGLAEMPSSWARAALSAQAIVGRTYAVRMLQHGTRSTCRCHLLATPADQAYNGLDKEEGLAGERWVAQVDATSGVVVRYGGALAATYYSSSHGGRSERIADSYAYSAPNSSFPYLDSVNDPFSDDPAVNNPFARWTKVVSNTGFARYVDPRLERVTGISVRSRTAGGTPRALAVAGVDSSGRALTVTFAGVDGKLVGGRRVWIAGVDLKRRFDLRSQQIIRMGLEPFGDDDGSVHEHAVATLAASGITTGCASARFCPGDAVTRAQAAALLVRALQLPSSAEDAFSDDGGSVHEADINALAGAGLANGCAANDYCPGRGLSRGQMAALLARALELPSTSVDAFPDDDGSVHEADVNRLAAAGITFGSSSSGRFAPGSKVTRAQLASFLVRALERA